MASIETVTILVVTGLGADGDHGQPDPGVRGLVTAHSGRMVRSTGGGTVAAFSSAARAVACARALHDESAGRDGDALSIGVASGDADVDGADVFGPPVDQATALAAVAAPGHVLVSALARQLAGERSSDDFVPATTIEPRSAATVDAYELRARPATSPPDGAWRVPLPGLLTFDAPFPFVGRSAEWSMLDEAWRAAESGHRQVVLVGGDAGTGKTRLVTELARSIHRRGGIVLYGACQEQVELPFQPFVEALDHALRATAAADRAGLVGADGAGELARVLPVLRQPSGDGAGERRDPDAERFRLFEAVTDLLAHLADRAPVLLLLEDLHWARRPTIRLLEHLVRSTRLGQVCVLATFRNAPGDMGDALRESLPELRRRPGVTRIAIGGFDADGVRSFVAAVAGQEIGPSLEPVVTHLIAATGGNPFLMGELWRHLVETGSVGRRRGGWAVLTPLARISSPESVREVVSSRLAGLPVPTQRLLRLAAVAGATFELGVVAAADGLDAAAAFDALEPAVEARLIDDAGGDQFRFAHALVRQSVEDSLSPGERRRLHLAVGRGLESASRPDLDMLAHHFAAAVPLAPAETAVSYARRAAADAMQQVAYDNAASVLSSVLPFVTDERLRVDVLLDLALATTRAGLTESSFDACHEAAAIARRLGDTERLSRAALGMQEATWRGAADGRQATELLREALADPPDVATRALLLSGLGTALSFSGRDEEAVPVVNDALASARSTGDRALLLQTLLCPLFLPWRASTIALQMAAADEGVALAEQLGDDEALLGMLDKVLVGLNFVGDIPRLRDVLDRHGRLARRLRQPLFQLTDAQIRCQLALDDGRFADAEAAAEEASSWSEALPHASGGFGVQMFSIRREQGRLDEVRPVVEAVARLDRSAPTWRAGLAALHAELGHVDEGTALLDQLVAEDLSTIPRDSLWTGALSFLADACVAANHRAAAELVHRELASSTGLRVAVVGLASYGAADRYLGRLAEVRGRPDEAEHYLEAALRLDERTGSPTWTAHSAYALGGFLARRGRRDDRSRARSLARRAQATATALGMATLATRCEALLAEITPNGSDAGAASPLTAREASVLRLVAQGRTNRQIGEQLHVSEHTVANHIRAILLKTRSANRAEAAAWAQRSGLLPL